jgi:hypothetical protein
LVLGRRLKVEWFEKGRRRLLGRRELVPMEDDERELNCLSR